jgi:hypothetical protein
MDLRTLGRLLVPIPSYGLMIESPLEAGAALTAIRGAVSEIPARPNILGQAAGRPFMGTVADDQFVLLRAVPVLGMSIFDPIVQGRIRPRGTETEIDLQMVLSGRARFILHVMAWSVLLMTSIALGLRMTGHVEPVPWNLYWSWGALAFMLVFSHVYSRDSAQKSARLLLRIFEGTGVSALRT